MRAFLLGPVVGEKNECRKVLKKCGIKAGDLRVGVDGGTAVWFEWGWKPDFAVGDWDSLPNKKGKNKILSQVPHLTLPKGKDRSDLFFAALTAISLGVEELICIGVTGGKRMDHHLATLYDLSMIATGKFGRLKKVQASGVDGDYHFLSEAIPAFEGVFPLNQITSIFALNGEARGVSLKGFRYPLQNSKLTLSSHGLSNQTAKRNCGVYLRKGQLLVIIPRDGTQ